MIKCGSVLTAGQVLDQRYEIIAPLAEGGMGAVYLARRTLLGDEVAIKVVRAEQTGPGPRERFLRESRACARQVGWFTCLVSKASNLPPLQAALRREQAGEVRVVAMAQGQKQSRFLAWRFA